MIKNGPSTCPTHTLPKQTFWSCGLPRCLGTIPDFNCLGYSKVKDKSDNGK